MPALTPRDVLSPVTSSAFDQGVQAMHHRGHSLSTRRASVLVALLILLLASTQLAFAAADFVH